MQGRLATQIFWLISLLKDPFATKKYNVSLYLWLTLALSGFFWLSLAFPGSLSGAHWLKWQGPCSARYWGPVYPALPHTTSLWYVLLRSIPPVTTTFWSKIPAFSPLIALLKHHHHHHHPRSNTYAQYQCLGRSPPFVHCWFGSNNSTLDRYLSFWSIPPATSKICFSKQQSGKNKIFF